MYMSSPFVRIAIASQGARDMNNQVSLHLDQNDFDLIDRRNFVIRIGSATVERKSARATTT
jgi:hypothetical protein